MTKKILKKLLQKDELATISKVMLEMLPVSDDTIQLVERYENWEKASKSKQLSKKELREEKEAIKKAFMLWIEKLPDNPDTEHKGKTVADIVRSINVISNVIEFFQTIFECYL